MNGTIFSVISVTALIAVSTQLNWLQSKLTMKKVVQNRTSVQLASAMETFLIAYRAAEDRYIKSLKSNGCAAAKSFLDAMNSGSVSGGKKCKDVSIFTGNDMGSDTLYTYPGAGCTISENSSDCKTVPGPIVTIGVSSEAQKIQGFSYKFSITAIRPEKHELEMMMEVTPPDGAKPFNNGFAIRSVLPNTAHLEVDSRVTQEATDPLARCAGSPWADYLVFNPVTKVCDRFVQLGSGTGLAIYNARFFGFRPMDGQVIDLLAASSPGASATSYLVDPADGTVSGIGKVFVPYDKDLLTNVDDITMIGDQIYYVESSTPSIGVLDMKSKTPKRQTICDLGADGWSQAYSGIAALSWSDPILPPKPPKSDWLQSRMATFYLKTDSGDLLTTTVTANGAGNTYECSTIKEPILQQVEYKRTLGFERTETAKPYYVY